MLSSILGSNQLESMLAGKGVTRVGKGIVRVDKIFNSASFFN